MGQNAWIKVGINSGQMTQVTGLKTRLEVRGDLPKPGPRASVAHVMHVHTKQYRLVIMKMVLCSTRLYLFIGVFFVIFGIKNYFIIFCLFYLCVDPVVFNFENFTMSFLCIIAQYKIFPEFFENKIIFINYCFNFLKDQLKLFYSENFILCLENIGEFYIKFLEFYGKWIILGKYFPIY